MKCSVHFLPLPGLFCFFEIFVHEFEECLVFIVLSYPPKRGILSKVVIVVPTLFHESITLIKLLGSFSSIYVTLYFQDNVCRSV